MHTSMDRSFPIAELNLKRVKNLRSAKPFFRVLSVRTDIMHDDVNWPDARISGFIQNILRLNC